MEVIYKESRLLVKHEIHKCNFPNICPEYGHHVLQLKIGSESTFLNEVQMKSLIKTLSKLVD